MVKDEGQERTRVLDPDENDILSLFTSSAGTGITTPFSNFFLKKGHGHSPLPHQVYAIPEVAASVCNRLCPISYRLESWYL